MFSRDTIVSVRLGNKGQATPSLETSKNSAEGRKHCFFGGPVSLTLFIYFFYFFNAVRRESRNNQLLSTISLW